MQNLLFLFLSFSLVFGLRVGTAWCQTNLYDEMFKSITALELQVKIVMKDDTSTHTTVDREHSELRDKLNITIEGTFRYKAYDLSMTPPPSWPPGVPYTPPPTPTYPRGPLLVPDMRSATISGSGDGDSYHWWLWEDCKDDDPSVCQDFKQEGTEVWQYNTVDSVYIKAEDTNDEKLVRYLQVRQDSENAPVRYTFDLWPTSIGDYVKLSGTSQSTVRSFETDETTSSPIPEQGANRGRSWTEFVDQYTNTISGDLKIENGRATGSGHIVHNYSYTSDDGDTETGTAEVFYVIRAILSTDQALDQTELGCPDGKCKQSGSASSPGVGYGAPAWSINMANLNIFITDTPIWYRSPIGPSMEITLSYNSKAPETQFEPVGRKWQLNYESFVSTDQATGDVTIYMPDGKRDIYTYTPTGFIPPYRVFNELKVTRQGGLFDGNDYDLTFPDGTVYVYKVPTWSYRWAFLMEIRDPYGQSLSLQWEGVFPFGGKLKQITDALGRATIFMQDDNNRITSVRDPFGRLAYFEYDPLGRLTKITDMGGYITTFTYAEGVLADDFSMIRRMVQGNNIWDFVFDGSSLTVTDNLGTEKFVLDAEQGVASYQGANADAGATYGYTLAPAQDGSKHKDIARFQTPEGVGLEFTYDTRGNLLTETLKGAGNDETTTYTYNAKGKVTSIQDGRGALTLLTYASNGVDLVELRQDGLGTITATYNDKHGITSLTDRLGNTKAFEYNGFGQTTRTTDALNIQTEFIYNEENQLLRIVRDGTVVNEYVYDAIGRISAYTDMNGYTRLYAYDNLDNLLSITDPDGRETTYTRSQSIPGQLDRITDRAGHTAYYNNYNTRRQVQEVVDPGGGTTHFAYYPDGNLRQLIDPNGNGTAFEYSKDNQLARKLFADGNSVRFTYANGRLAQFTNARGITTDFTYDRNGNVVSVLYSDQTPGITTTYDAYNRPVEVRDGLGLHTITYDAQSRPVTIDGPWDNDTLTFAYDALGRRTSVALEMGPTVSYSYDELNRLTAVSGNEITYTFQYQGGTNLLERLDRSDGSRTEYTYDTTMKRLKQYTNRDRTGSILNEYTFNFDAFGQPTEENVANDPALHFSGAGVTFSYNNLNQMVSLGGGAADAFAYDADGNMTKGLTGDGRAFDAAYDAENRLASIQYTDDAGVVRRQEYIYGADGFLGIQKNYADGVLTGEQRFIRYGGKLLQERDSGNNVVRAYLWSMTGTGGAGALLSLLQNQKTYQYYSNPRGDVIAVLNSDGETVAAYAYDPFGVPLAAVGTLKQPMRFSTKAYDEGTGLYYYGFRFYSPQLGRWLSRDPLGEKGGINLYGFVQNNPVNSFDPYGLSGKNFFESGFFAFNHALEVSAVYGFAQIGATIGELSLAYFIRIPDAVCGANILNKSNQQLQRTTLWEYVHNGVGPQVSEAWHHVFGSSEPSASKEPVVTDEGPVTIRPARDREPVITDDGPIVITPARARDRNR